MYLHIYISLKAIFLLHIGFGVKRSLFQHIKSEYISTLYSSQALMHKYILWQKKFRIKILVEINKVTQILEPTLHFQKCFFSPFTKANCAKPVQMAPSLCGSSSVCSLSGIFRFVSCAHSSSQVFRSRITSVHV